MIVKAVKIDGKFEDWPGDTPTYHFKYRRGAEFRVAYSPAANRLYVAVQTPDPDLIVGHHWRSTDSCAVAVWGGDRSASPTEYYLVPGRGSDGR
jgi:hypothetical protein